MVSRMKIGFILLILAIIVPRVIRLVMFMKFGKVVFHNEPGPCRLIKGIKHGSEDMQALPNGMIFISSGLRFQVDWNVSPWKERKGQIFLYDYNSADKGAVPLKIEGDLNLAEFNPHGISIWNEDGKVTLFVVNHPPSAEVIERFSFDVKTPTVLKHEETIASEFIMFPNDVVAVGPRQFYITNYARFHGHDSILAKVEAYGMFHLATVAYYDGSSSRIVADGMLLANGINRSPDGKYIYVMNIGDEEIRVYERQVDSSLELRQSFHVPGAIDNIDVDATTGDLWVGGHPVPSAAIGTMEDPDKPAPSQALRLKTKDGLITEIVEVYSEDGTKYISGSSVAVKFKNKMLVGTVNNKAIECDILHEE